jgi:phosphoribosylaminoimidazolecarboxamide formyltransferase/IMP cyclohydrolase
LVILRSIVFYLKVKRNHMSFGGPGRALLSVHDKTGLVDLGQALSLLGWDLVASGGTAKALADAGLFVTSIERVTNQPEMLGGRVKTLHPAIHGGILARDTEEDMRTLQQYGYAPISLVVCNLYPFKETVAKEGVTLDEAIEQIDIGGVALIRAAAKNFSRVIVLCDPADYAAVIAKLRAGDTIDLEMRRKLAVKAFHLTRDYDAAIYGYLSSETQPAADTLPDMFSLSLCKVEELRYGENPHQRGALYTAPGDNRVLGGQVLGGKSLSYNNILDLEAAWRTVGLFETPTVVIVKHLTPCGIASGATLAEAFPKALASDPVSAYGGVIAVNSEIDQAFVTALGDLFVEAIAAPAFTSEAQKMLAEKRKNCRLLSIDPNANAGALEYRSVQGGLLVQSLDKGDPTETQWKVVSKRQPTAEELEALHFAWKACQFVKSNAIVLATSDATVGIGGGLPSRVDAARLAVEKAGEHAQGTVMASDAFFPFPDSIEVGIAAGITAIVSPGGSIRDDQAIAAADAANLAMVFTGVRHFRH